MTKTELAAAKLVERAVRLEAIFKEADARKALPRPEPCLAMAFCTLPGGHAAACDEPWQDNVYVQAGLF